MSRRSASALAAAAVLAQVASAAGAEGSRTKAPVATIDHVRIAAGGKELAGWPLDPEAEKGYALLCDDGAIVVVPPQPPPQVGDVSPQPVTVLPVASLVGGLEHAEIGVRERCQELLTTLGDDVIPRVAPALKSRSVEARRRGLEILAQHPSQKQLDRIAECLDDSDERVREAALRAYATLKPEDLCTRCIAVLVKDPSIYVRHEAIVRLGRDGDARVIDPLFRHLDGCQERSLRIVTFDALRRLTGRTFGRDETQWRSWWTNHRSEYIVGDGR